MRAVPLCSEPSTGRLIVCQPEEATRIYLEMPGETGSLVLPVEHKDNAKLKEPCWRWNKDTERPTIRPSIRTRMGRKMERVCHSFVTDGEVNFLTDCTHDLAGKTVPLPDVEWD